MSWIDYEEWEAEREFMDNGPKGVSINYPIQDELDTIPKSLIDDYDSIVPTFGTVVIPPLSYKPLSFGGLPTEEVAEILINTLTRDEDSR